jgi:hypothetical protein
MDLLASSGSSVPAALVRKAVGTWAARRQFWGVANSQFSASIGTVGSSGQILQCHHNGDACMGAVGERAQGFWSGARGGGEKVSMPMVLIGSLG